MTDKMDDISEGLSTAALGLLLLSPQQRPASWTFSAGVQQLLTARLLEENPTTRGLYRATELGGQLIKHLAKKHV